MRGGDLEHEGDREEHPARPPADLREQIASLTRADERIGRRAHAAEACRHASALSALEQNGGDEEETIENEQDE